MSSTGGDLDRYRFGAFELVPDQGELLRDGRPVALQPQPLRVLTVLVRQAGRLVPRADLIEEVWGEGTHVDFDRSLNYCVRQIRAALDDDAADPRFIRTQPRLGYRFIAPVRQGAADETAGASTRGWHPVQRVAALTSTLLVLSLGLAWWLVPSSSGRAEAHPEALQEYLRGQHLLERGAPEDARRARAHFERSVSIDPGFSRAHLGLARVALQAAGNPAGNVERSRASVTRALQLDPELAPAHAHLAALRRYADWDWEGAEAAYRRAVTLDPERAGLRHEYAGFLAMLGRHEAAIEQVERAMELDPVSTAIKADAGWFYYLARRFDDADRLCELTLELDAENRNALWCLIQTRQRLGDDAGALRASRRLAAAFERDATPPDLPDLDAFWRWHLAWLDRHPEMGSPSTVGLDHLALGDHDRALDLFEAAYERRSACVLTLAADPQVDPLRGEPRFEKLLARLGLPG